MNTLYSMSQFGEEPTGGVSDVKSIAQMQAESDVLYAAEQTALVQDSTQSTTIASIRALRADRIKRQQAYIDLGITNETIQIVESLTTDKQKWAAIDQESILKEHKDMNFSLMSWVQEEQAIEQGKAMGATMALNIQFAAQRSRDGRLVQAKAIQRMKEAEADKSTKNIEDMRKLSADKRLERNTKYEKYILKIPCTQWAPGETQENPLSEYGWFEKVGVSRIYQAQMFVPPYWKNLPYITKTAETYAGSGATRTVYYFKKQDVMDWSTQLVLADPSAFMSNSLRTMKSGGSSTAYVTNRKFGPAYTVGTGTADLNYLCQAILNECYPFYEDYASGVKQYPYFIDYGENVAWPTPEQFFIGVYKILRIGTLEWGKEMLTQLQKLSDINVDPNATQNTLFNPPVNLKYHHPMINGSLYPYPIEAKENPDYLPWKFYKELYQLTDAEAQSYYNDWILVLKSKNLNIKMGDTIDDIYPLAKSSSNAAGVDYKYYSRDLDSQEIKTYVAGWFVNSTYKMARYDLERIFQNKYPAIYLKVVAMNHYTKQYRDNIYDFRDQYWFKDEDYPERARYLNTNPAYSPVFPEIGPFNTPTYYSLRPKFGFVYVPKVGYVNPLMMFSFPTAFVQSPKAYADRQRRIAENANKQGLLQRFAGIISPQGFATIVGELTQGLGSSFSQYMMSETLRSFALVGFFANLTQGHDITREQSKAAIALAIQAVSIAATAGTAGVVVAAVSVVTQELGKMGLGDTDFGKAIMTIGQAIVISQAAGSTLAQALSAAAEREAKNQIVRIVAKSTHLDTSIIGTIAVQIAVESFGAFALDRSFMDTLVESSKKGAMLAAATQIPGGQYLVQAAFDVYNDGWDAILPSNDVMKILDDPAAAVAGIDFKKIGDKIITQLKEKQNQQVILALATGKLDGSALAKSVISQKLAADLKQKTAMTDVARNQNDPAVQAAAKMTQEIQLAIRRDQVSQELLAGRKLRREDLTILNPMAKYYYDIIKEVIPEAQQVDALVIGLKIGMPNIKDYVKLRGPKLNLPGLPSIDGSMLDIDIPFKVPKLSLMSLGIKLPSLPSVGPDLLQIKDLPKLNMNLSIPDLEIVVKNILPKNVKLEPVLPTPGVAPGYNIVDFNGDLHISPGLQPSIYEHSMLTFGQVPRHETQAQQLYNMVRDTEIKMAMLEIQKAEDAMAMGAIVV